MKLKNNISYFPHKVVSPNHWKFKTLRRKYGWAGEGKFWALNCMIAESDFCKLDIRDRDKKTAIATDLDFDLVEFDSYVSFLVDVAKLVTMEDDGFLLTDITQETLLEVDVKRERQREWKKEKSSKSKESTSKEKEFTSTSVKSTSKVDKENRIELNKTKENEINKDQIQAASRPSVLRKIFISPTREELRAFVTAAMSPKWPSDKCQNEADTYFDHYKANGWKQQQGKPIVDWEAAIRNCIRRGIKGTFDKPEIVYQQKETPAPKIPEVIKPTLAKIQAEFNFLYARFLEKEITVISVDVSHYNYLKTNCNVEWTAAQKAEIEKIAIQHLEEKNIEVNETEKLKYMKKIAVLEFFKHLQEQGRETVFEIELLSC